MKGKTEVVIALGTNIGNRCRNLSAALKEMKQMGVDVTWLECVRRTSPVGITDQPEFLNAAVLATTNHDPITLLRKLKEIEAEMGRDFQAERYGPRPIDLDIIFYGDKEIQADKCTIPHPRWKERDFVKIPLGDLARSYFSVNTLSSSTVKDRLAEVEGLPTGVGSEQTNQVSVLGRDHVEQLGMKTWLMHVLNITPDSFSDGGVLLSKGNEMNKSAVMDSARKAVTHGARIIDIGGQSTRPGSSVVEEETEASRVLPVVRLLREELGDQCPYLSVDTFYSSVAKEAVAAGVDVVNDISGGVRDPQMLQTVAFSILESEGERSHTMTHAENLMYSDNPIQDVGTQLQHVAEAAMESGIPPWKQILDPGIGFAKTRETSFKVLLELQRLKGEILKGSAAKTPLLVGHSRKRFLSAFTGADKEPSERDLLSCGMALDCVRNGADILRMHNSEMAQQILSLADALYRTHQLPPIP